MISSQEIQKNKMVHLNNVVSQRIKIIDQTSFILSESSFQEANNLRKFYLEKMETIAFDTIIIHKNTSSMNDDLLASRIGLIPLIIDACVCVDNEVCDVCCKTIRFWSKTNRVLSQEISELCKPGIIVCNLERDQEIDVTVITRKGTAQDHAKWSLFDAMYYEPQSKTSFKFLIEMNSEIIPIESIIEMGIRYLK